MVSALVKQNDSISCRKLHKAKEYPHILSTAITDMEIIYCNHITCFPKSLKSFLFENFSADLENRIPSNRCKPTEIRWNHRKPTANCEEMKNQKKRGFRIPPHAS